MTVYDAVMKRRTIRKFMQKKIERDKLVKLVDCARMAAYGANLQPLKFAIIDDDKKLSDVFPFIKWAGYLEDGAPKQNERPAAYIAVLGDKSIKQSDTYEVEAGAAVTTMMLAAEEMEIASCWLGAIKRDEIKQVLEIDDKFSVVYLLALGYPMQKSEPVEMKDDIKYYLDGDVLKVPKRSLNEVLIDLK